MQQGPSKGQRGFLIQKYQRTEEATGEIRVGNRVVVRERKSRKREGGKLSESRERYVS